jgi:hypothetical protein
MGRIATNWVDLAAQDDDILKRSELLIEKEVDWAAHLGLASVVFEIPDETSIHNFARLLNFACTKLLYSKVK